LRRARATACGCGSRATQALWAVRAGGRAWHVYVGGKDVSFGVCGCVHKDTQTDLEQCQADGARAAADVQEAEAAAAGFGHVQHPLHQLLGLGPGDEDRGRHL
jgi:hypothetical protein